MNIKFITSRSALVLLATLSASCVDSENKSQAVQAVSKTEAAPVKVEKSVASTPKQNSGIVKSVQMSSGYSYIEVDVLGDIFWLATSVSAVKPGDDIAWNSYAMMKQFKSKGLNREFDQILFVDRVFETAALSQQGHSGTVIEAMTSAGYSYIQVEENGARVWLAAPQSAVKAGQLIRWDSTAPMRNFNSPSLNRTFDEIYFVSGISHS